MAAEVVKRLVLTTSAAVCFLFIIIIIIRNKKHELSLRRVYRYHNFKSDKGTDHAAGRVWLRRLLKDSF